MSRLYLVGNTDKVKTPKTACGYEHAQAEIRWGSAGDSRLAVWASVHWPRGDAKPLVEVSVPEGVDVRAHVPGYAPQLMAQGVE